MRIKIGPFVVKLRMMPTRQFRLRESPLRRKMWLTSLAERFLFAGITSTDRLVRRRQLFTNIAAYVLALNILVHFTFNAIYDFEGLLVVNVYNVLIFLFCALNHRLHVFGALVAAVTLIVGVIVGHSFVVFAFGTASNLQFYFTLAGFVLFLVGVENFPVFLALYAVAFAALLVAFVFAPVNGLVLPGRQRTAPQPFDRGGAQCLSDERTAVLVRVDSRVSRRRAFRGAPHNDLAEADSRTAQGIARRPYR